MGEPPPAPAPHAPQGFWSPRNANIHFCEPTYVASPYVAEWWNTVSNGSTVVLGLAAFCDFYSLGNPEPRFRPLQRGARTVAAMRMQFMLTALLLAGIGV